MSARRWILAVILLLVGAPSASLTGGDSEAVWLVLEPGLEEVRFDVATRRPTADGDLTVLRIDPALFALKLLVTDGRDDAAGRDVAEWCVEYGLLAAVNAGMYQADRRTHVGFFQVEGRVLNGFANDYLSAAAFGPRDPADPPFRIFDLDVTPLEEVRERYANVAQNLRLIKRDGENRWQPATDRWREVALAEDEWGRTLFVSCRTPLSMHDFNALLLDLPLGVVAAQHLEGRHQARYWVAHPFYESGPGSLQPGPELPNVLGVVRRLSAAGLPSGGTGAQADTSGP